MSKNKNKKAVNHITRAIDNKVERVLWARAAGRCEFDDCNEILYRSSVTQEPVNVAEMAHIYAFSEEGPRGWTGFWGTSKDLNSVDNLILVCRKCHKLIDEDKEGIRYSADLLRRWKRQHEDRVEMVTGTHPSKKSHVVLYGGKIGEEYSPLDPALAMNAMFPNWNPSEPRAINLTLKCEHEDKSPEFWQTEEAHLRAKFEREIRPRIEEASPNHFSIFARADQPLLVLLGALFTDKVPANVYQLHREPAPNWNWKEHPDGFEFTINRPINKGRQPVLAFSLSGKVTPDRITKVLGDDIALWEFTVPECHNRVICSEAQLGMFREQVCKLIAEINAAYPQAKHICIFPAMPVSCAVELGRIRMPRADIPWMIYDQNHKLGGFVHALTIGEPKL